MHRIVRHKLSQYGRKLTACYIANHSSQKPPVEVPSSMSQASLKPVNISKSRYMSGRQCVRKLWLETHRSDLAAPVDIATQFIFDQGHEVGEFAMKWRGEGVLVELNLRNIPQAYKDTQAALAAGEKRIHQRQACLQYLRNWRRWWQRHSHARTTHTGYRDARPARASGVPARACRDCR